jgi:hypothetical protein
LSAATNIGAVAGKGAVSGSAQPTTIILIDKGEAMSLPKLLIATTLLVSASSLTLAATAPLSEASSAPIAAIGDSSLLHGFTQAGTTATRHVLIANDDPTSNTKPAKAKKGKKKPGSDDPVVDHKKKAE